MVYSSVLTLMLAAVSKKFWAVRRGSAGLWPGTCRPKGRRYTNCRAGFNRHKGLLPRCSMAVKLDITIVVVCVFNNFWGYPFIFHTCYLSGQLADTRGCCQDTAWPSSWT
jgi:hypothetical protein